MLQKKCSMKKKKKGGKNFQSAKAIRRPGRVLIAACETKTKQYVGLVK